MFSCDNSGYIRCSVYRDQRRRNVPDYLYLRSTAQWATLPSPSNAVLPVHLYNTQPMAGFGVLLLIVGSLGLIVSIVVDRQNETSTYV